jgi:hypothetical protein
MSQREYDKCVSEGIMYNIRKIEVFIHVSLDGFFAGRNNEIDWFKIIKRTGVGKAYLHGIALYTNYIYHLQLCIISIDMSLVLANLNLTTLNKDRGKVQR